MSDQKTEDSFKSKQISHFQTVTGCDEESANHYLDAANQDLTIALDQYFLTNSNQNTVKDGEKSGKSNPSSLNPNFKKGPGEGSLNSYKSTTNSSSNLKTLDMLKNVRV